MRLFHLSYDNGEMDTKDVVRFLRDKFEVSEIGRPVESTLVFRPPAPVDRFDRMANVLKRRFISPAPRALVST